jgi:hypothetical protein
VKSSVLPEKAEGRPRKRIGRYLVVGRIGRGGMGMVYRGLDEALEREVAVKTLTVEGSLDAESRKRFQVEAKAAAKLQHPNIVTVFELGEDRGVAFIAMELLPGVDLEALIRSGEPMLLREKLDIVIQVCRGLAYAHEHGVVHRDIKPSNIRLLDDGTAKIMDFGIAKLGGTTLTKTGMMVGTVHYMSPEQIRGRPLDGRSDVFSLGVILYELLAGQRPFKGEGATEVLYKIVNEDPPPLDVAGLDPRLREVAARALAKERDQRFPSAAALAEALSEVAAAHEAAAGRGAAEVAEAVGFARRFLKEGRPEEGLARVRELAARHPDSVEARRALRTLLRETERGRRPPEPAGDDFPELDVTFQAPPTQRAAETDVQPTVVAVTEAEAAPPARRGRASRGLLWGGGAVALVAAAVGAALLARGAGPKPPAEVRLLVRSQPPGASVLVEGTERLVTDGDLVLASPVPAQVALTFRKRGYRDETRTVALPLPPGEALTVALAPEAAKLPVISDPPGGTVSLDGQRLPGVTPLDVALDPTAEHRLTIGLEGHAPREVRVVPGQVPSEIRVKLEAAGPPGLVRVASVYPVDVLWRGKVLAREQVAPAVSLPGGHQVLTVVSAAHFLRADLPVEVRGGAETTLEVPGLGRLNIRAQPDNCQVFIDGAFVDYPPILDRRVAAGTHTVAFKWPDGAKAEEAVTVVGGSAAYVTGRKD